MLKIKDFTLDVEDLFGNYCYIEQKRYYGENALLYEENKQLKEDKRKIRNI